LLKASLDLPKRAEFHLAKRLLKEAEELLARCDYIKATEKAWAAAQIVNAAKKGKELKSAATRQRNSRRRQRAEEAWSYADVPAKTSTGWTPPGDVKYAVEDVERFVERFKKLL
jgi:hypothetical protein